MCKMKVALILVIAVAANAVDAGGDASTTSTSQKVDNIMSAVEDHCSARRKRQVGPSSEDKVRQLILNVVKDCLEEDKTETQKPPSTYSFTDPTTTTSTTRSGPSSSTSSTRTATTTTATSSSTTPSTFTTATTPIPNPTDYYTTTSQPVPDGPCNSPNTVNLTEGWRLDHNGSNIKPDNGEYNCDENLLNNRIWFRVTGAAGNHILNKCPPPHSCGSNGGLWTDAPMPEAVGQVEEYYIYGALDGNCIKYGYTLITQRCSNRKGDFVHFMITAGLCDFSVCGMNLS